MPKDSILKQVQDICKMYGVTPARSKGQNFLINPLVIKKIAASANLKKDDTVLEVGPGLGILTEELVKLAKKIISVELDKKLYDFLKIKFVNQENLDLRNQDILDFKIENFPLQTNQYQLVANLPYNITSVFLRKFLSGDNCPQSMTLLLQKEVAQRICAKPGKMSLLAISVQVYGQPKIVEYVPKQDFWPSPEVDSAIIKINNIKSKTEVDKYFSQISENKFWRVVKIGFSAKRKQLQHNLAAGLSITPDEAKKMLVSVNLDSKVRAQNLSLEDWLALIQQLPLDTK